MQCVVQRVTSASVTVAGDVVGEIGPGLVLLVGIAAGDSDDQLRWMAEKVAKLRIFSDADGKFNESLLDTGGAVLSVSQFTLLGDVSRGNRPSFVAAAPPDEAEPLYVRVCELLGAQRGRFGAEMAVELVNDGPVTLLVEA